MQFRVSTAPPDPKFGMASHVISSHNGDSDNGNQTKHQYIQKAFINNIAKIEESQIRCTQYDFLDIFMVPAIHDDSALHPAFMWNGDQCNLFCTVTHSHLKTMAYDGTVSIRDVMGMIK